MNWVKPASAAPAGENSNPKASRSAITKTRRPDSSRISILSCISFTILYIMIIYNMIDLKRITGFDWDDGNSRKSADKHGVGQAEAEQVFLNTPLLLLHDLGHSASEQRYHAYGKTHAGRLLQIAFTLRQEATLVRIISVRPMSAKERTRYAEET